MTVKITESENDLTAVEVESSAEIVEVFGSAMSNEVCASMPAIQAAACRSCHVKLLKASDDEHYAKANEELLKKCNDPTFLSLFMTTEHLEALALDISPQYIFDFKNIFQTKAIIECRDKIKQAQNDKNFEVENRVMLAQCADTKNILMVYKGIQLEVLRLYNVPPADTLQFYSRDQVCALQYGVDFANASKFDQPRCLLLYKLIKRNMAFDVKLILKIRNTIQASAILENVPFEAAQNFKSDDSVKFIKMSKEKYHEEIEKDPQFFTWLIEKAQLVQNKVALFGLNYGFTIEQTVKTKDVPSLIKYFGVNIVAALTCFFTLHHFLCTTTEEADYMDFVGETQFCSESLEC